MATKGAEKIIEALTQLMEGYIELQESVERDFGGREGDDETELSSEVDSALVTEVRAAIESVMEEEDYSAEEFASVISMVTDALEEIDPDVFDQEEEDEEDDEDEDEDEDDDDDEDFDDDEDSDDDDDDR